MELTEMRFGTRRRHIVRQIERHPSLYIICRNGKPFAYNRSLQGAMDFVFGIDPGRKWIHAKGDGVWSYTIHNGTVYEVIET